MTRLWVPVLVMMGVDGGELATTLFGESFSSFWRLFGGGVCCAIAAKEEAGRMGVEKSG